MDRADAELFVGRWVNDWNSHDIEAILSHFTDDVVFSSPLAIQILGGSGEVRGKEELRRYWTEGLRRSPDLCFEVLAFYVGVDVLVINYRNQKGNLLCEVLRFEGPLVSEGHGTYLPGDPSAS
jgi:hypothetical protein